MVFGNVIFFSCTANGATSQLLRLAGKLVMPFAKYSIIFGVLLKVLFSSDRNWR